MKTHEKQELHTRLNEHWQQQLSIVAKKSSKIEYEDEYDNNNERKTEDEGKQQKRRKKKERIAKSQCKSYNRTIYKESYTYGTSIIIIYIKWTFGLRKHDDKSK